MSSVSDYTNYQNSTQRLKDSYDADRASMEENHENEIKQLKASYESEIEESRKDLNNQIAKERASARDEIQKLKDELYDSKGKKSAIAAREELEQKKELSRYQEQTQKDADHRVEAARDYATQKIVEADERTDHKVEDAVNAQKKAYSQQIHDLQDEVAVYRNEHRDLNSDRAQAKQAVVKEYEKGRLDEQKRITETYDRELARAKAESGEREDQTSRKIADITFEANEKAKDTIRAQKAEFKGLERDYRLQNNYEKATHQTELKNEQFQNQMAQDHLIEKHAKDTLDLAKNKDEVYGKYIADKDHAMNAEIAMRDQKIQEMARNDDPLKASPYLVSRIHQGEEKRFTAQMNENEKVHQENLHATRDRDVSERRKLQDDYRQKFAINEREHRREGDLQTRQFMTSYQDLKEQSSNALMSERERSIKHAERVRQDGALALVEEHQHASEALDEQRVQSTHEKNALLDEADNGRRSQDREWNMRMNDLRRNFEQQLSIQRDEYEKNMSELHLEYDKKLREMDRGSKRALEDRVRAYEHQIKQQDLAYREKERFLSEHYQEELDSMKRTNAQLIQKKS